MMTTSDGSLLSYWQATTMDLPLSADVPSETDVVIVGGGILGAGLCYWLAKLGMTPLLLEQTAPAYGATGRNGGFLSIGPAGSYRDAEARFGPATAQAILQVTRENQALLHQILEEEHIDCEYRKLGSIHLALDEEQWRELVQDADALRERQIQTTMLDRKQLQSIIATSLSEEIIGGRFFPEDAVIHPIKLVQGLLQAARRYDACICRARVIQLSPAKDATILTTTVGSLSARKILVATNAWIGELLPSFARLVTPVRGQMLSYAPAPSIFPVGMSSSLSLTGEYWHQRVDGTIVLGGCRAAAPGSDEGITQSIPSQEVQMALEKIFPRLFPQLRNLQVQHRWAGLMAFTPDLLPIADQVPDLPGCWGVGGFSGHGMPFGMRLSQLLAEAIITGKPSDNLNCFRLSRPTLCSD
jgi:gamma-glutamylputrescine oxidase